MFDVGLISHGVLFVLASDVQLAVYCFVVWLDVCRCAEGFHGNRCAIRNIEDVFDEG